MCRLFGVLVIATSLASSPASAAFDIECLNRPRGTPLETIVRLWSVDGLTAHYTNTVYKSDDKVLCWDNESLGLQWSGNSVHLRGNVICGIGSEVTTGEVEMDLDIQKMELKWDTSVLPCRIRK
jgi:hypothetical protein